MKLFLLKPRSDRELKYNSHISEYRDPFSGYDVKKGFLIQAETEKRAREIAEENAGDELYSSVHRWEDASFEDEEFVYYDGIWTNERLVECIDLTEEIGKEEEILLQDYKRG